ncbi:fumarylacetoacetate (FAA) hydrolase family protein [Arthrobacter sp. W4I7]|nr:fumarylacetoacetate (FAA) hydrolase family protein [Arthrobacter sp. W4I7]
MNTATADQILPVDADTALLVGRVWDPESGGPPGSLRQGAGRLRPYC